MYQGEFRIRFQDYSTEIWEDWSQWLIEAPDYSERIESESPGLPGVIAFDTANLILRYEPGIRPYEVFSGDLTSETRFIFEISAPDNIGVKHEKLEGIVDIGSIKTPFYQKEISFDVIDRLSAINKLVKQNIRTQGTVFTNVYTGTADRINYTKFWNTYDIQFRYTRSNMLVTTTTDENTPDLGEILKLDFLRDPSSGDLPDHLGLITFKHFDSAFSNGRVFYGIHSENTGFYASTTDADATGTADEKVRTDTEWYSSLFYNQDIYLKRYRDNDYPITKYIHPGPQTEYVSGWEIYAFDGIKLIEAIVKQQWSGITVVNRTGDTDFEVPLSFFTELIGENPFGEHPFDALVYLADTMKCYIMLNQDDELVIQSKSNIGTLAGTERTIGSTRIYDQDPKYSWDKLVDGVEITVKSWLKDENGDEISGFASLYKGDIKPKNVLKKTLLCSDPTASDSQALNAVAYNEAVAYMDFYGKRHKYNKLSLDLDTNTILWKLTDWVNIEEEMYFILSIDTDNTSKKIDVEIVSVIGYTYDARGIHIGRASGMFNSGGSSSTVISSSGGGTTGHSHVNLAILDNITAAFTVELKSDYDSAVSLKHSHSNKSLLDTYTNTNALISDAINLRHSHSNKSLLDVINQELATTNTPSFSQINLGSPANVNQAVIAGRTLQFTTTAPLTINNSSVLNLLSNRSWTLGLTTGDVFGTAKQVNVTGTGQIVGSNLILSTPQDIDTDSIVQFAGLKIGTVSSPFDVNLKDNFTFGSIGFSGNNTSIFSGSGIKLWGEIDKYSMVLDNLTVRNSMNIWELVINQIRGTNGSLLVTSACKIDSAEWYSGSYTEQHYIMETADDAFHGFKVGDLIRCKRTRFSGTPSGGDISGEYGVEVVYEIKMQVTWVSTLQRFSAKTIGIPNISGWESQIGPLSEIQKQTNIELLKGKEFFRTGHPTDTSRQGLIYLTSDDLDSPFIDILDGLTSHDSLGQFSKVKTRLGKLTGLTDPDLGNLQGYGLYATNAYLKGGIVASFGKIAGHDITTTGIKKESGFSVMEMNSDGMYFLSGYGQDMFGDGIFTLMGKIPAGLPGAGQMGIINHSAYDSKTYFVMSESVHKLSAWNFDETKLFNSDTRIESSSSLKGLAVKNSSGTDILKVGDFTRAAKSYSTASFSIPAGWVTGSNSHPTIFTIASGSFYPTASTGYTQFMAQVYKSLDVNTVKGKSIKIDFQIAETENSQGDALINVTAVIETDAGSFGLVNITPASVQTPVSWTNVSISANLPASITYARLKLILAYNSNPAMSTVEVQNFTGVYYNRTITELNKDGFRMYNSPLSEVELSNSGVTLNVPEVKTNAINLSGFKFVPSFYLAGDGVTIKSRLELKYNNSTIDAWDT